MNGKVLRLALVALGVLMAAAGRAAASDDQCQTMLAEAKRTSSSLTYRDFDQTAGQGWRRLADHSCYLEAAYLVDSYLAIRPDLHSSERVNLSFHAGQLYASGGNYDEAIARLQRAVVNPSSPPEFRWSEYVLATIAFLQHDPEALVKNRDLIADGGNDSGNQSNLKVVDRLIANFDRPYREAIGLAK